MELTAGDYVLRLNLLIGSFDAAGAACHEVALDVEIQPTAMLEHRLEVYNPLCGANGTRVAAVPDDVPTMVTETVSGKSSRLHVPKPRSGGSDDQTLWTHEFRVGVPAGRAAVVRFDVGTRFLEGDVDLRIAQRVREEHQEHAGCLALVHRVRVGAQRPCRAGRPAQRRVHARALFRRWRPSRRTSTACTLSSTMPSTSWSRLSWSSTARLGGCPSR